MIRAIPLICFLVLFGASAACADDEMFKIGYVLDLSGKGAFIGVQSRAGAELARLELEKEGTPVTIIYGDHRTDAKTAVTEVTKLIQADHVRAVLADMTPAVLAISPIVSRAGKLLIYQSPAKSVLDSNKLAFKNFLDYEEGCRLMAESFKKSGVHKFAALKLEAEFGELCVKGSAAVFPDQVVVAFTSGDDLHTQVARLKAGGIEAIIQTGYEVDYINQFDAAREVEFKPKVGLPAPLMTDLVSKAAECDQSGRIMVFNYPAIDPAFVERLKAADLYTSDNSIQSAAIAYMHVRQLVRVFHKCLIGESGCEAVEFSKQGPDATLSFEGWKGRNGAYRWRVTAPECRN